MQNMMIKIVESRIDQTEVLESVRSDCCGANLLFLGTTRSLTGGRTTEKLVYECYESMATSEMSKLAELAAENWSIERVAIVHRVGDDRSWRGEYRCCSQQPASRRRI